MTLKRTMIAAALLSGLCVGTAAGADAPAPVTGAGSSFAAPIYGAWAGDYLAASKIQIGYEAVGSGAGVARIKEAKSDFGGTDAPLGPDELAKNKLVQFPSVLGAVVPVINMPGIDNGRLKLDGAVLAAIFSGEIKHWNDARIQALNPGMPLPEWPITVVHRADKSGTTFQFTSYLSAVSPAWKAAKGAGLTLDWPVGLAGTGNAGVHEIMSSTLGTIGYVEYAYAKQFQLDMVLLKNHDGAFVTPNVEGFKAAASSAVWSSANGYGTSLLDQPGAASWPITAATFVLVRKDGDATRRKTVMDFFAWGFAHGDAAADKLGYVPLPAPLKSRLMAEWPKAFEP